MDWVNYLIIIIVSALTSLIFQFIKYKYEVNRNERMLKELVERWND